MTVKWLAGTDQAIEDESWGIENVTIVTHTRYPVVSLSFVWDFCAGRCFLIFFGNFAIPQIRKKKTKKSNMCVFNVIITNDRFYFNEWIFEIVDRCIIIL